MLWNICLTPVTGYALEGSTPDQLVWNLLRWPLSVFPPQSALQWKILFFICYICITNTCFIENEAAQWAEYKVFKMSSILNIWSSNINLFNSDGDNFYFWCSEASSYFFYRSLFKGMGLKVFLYIKEIWRWTSRGGGGLWVGKAINLQKIPFKYQKCVPPFIFNKTVSWARLDSLQADCGPSSKNSCYTTLYILQCCWHFR